jgi:hypothetical protein
MGLSYGYRAKECRNFKELKDKNPTLQDGTYKLFPNGENSAPISCYCMEYNGRHYQSVWQNFGGPAYATFGTNTSNSTLFANQTTYNGVCIPYSVRGTMQSQINKDLYTYWKSKDNVVWYKRVRSYNTNGTLNTGGTQGSATGSYYSDVFLTYDSGANFANSFSTGTGQMSGYVNMKFTIGSNTIDYGRTRYRCPYNNSITIGFANETDNGSIPAGEDLMGNGNTYYSTVGWDARHVLSYNHTSNAQNATRCQFECWSGNEGVCMETTWFVREKDNDE